MKLQRLWLKFILRIKTSLNLQKNLQNKKLLKKKYIKKILLTGENGFLGKKIKKKTFKKKNFLLIKKKVVLNIV